MKITLSLNNELKECQINTTNYYCISQFISPTQNTNAYFIPPAHFTPFVAGSFIGNINLGGACNCENITFNAHGNGTHTECVGHISKEKVSMQNINLPLFIDSQLIKVKPTLKENGDLIIDNESYNWDSLKPSTAIIISSNQPPFAQFSGQNPCYFDPKITHYLANKGFNHLLTDLPSVDREEDSGLLLAHKAFFNYPNQISLDKSITELCFIESGIAESNYVLNIQKAAFDTDAVPSIITIFPYEY